MNVRRRSTLLTRLIDTVDVMIAPIGAVDRIAKTPNWIFPALTIGALTATGTALAVPADLHVVSIETHARFASDPVLSQMSSMQRSQIAATVAGVMKWNWIIASVFALLLIGLQSGILSLAVLVAHGRGRPAQLFSLVLHTALVGTGLAALVQGFIVYVRGVDSFTSTSDLMLALPSVAWLLPALHGPGFAALTTLNPLVVWAGIILAVGLARIAHMSRWQAISISCVPAATAAVLAALYSR